MLYLIDNKTGFYYLGPENQVYSFSDSRRIPSKFRAIPDVRAESLNPEQYGQFVTGLWNAGITETVYDGEPFPIDPTDLLYVRKDTMMLTMSKFTLNMRTEDYKKLLDEDAYFVIQFLANGYNSVLTMNWPKKDSGKRYLPLAFSDRKDAEDLIKKKKWKDRRILKYAIRPLLMDGGACILSGRNMKVLLERETNGR